MGPQLIRSCPGFIAPINTCDKVKADLVFVVDSSGSINDKNPMNWDLVLSFIAGLCATFTIGQDAVRVGLVEYSENARNIFFLNQYYDIASLTSAIRNTPYLGSYTNTSGGIRVMHQEQFVLGRGDRPDVDNIAIVVTDGESNLDQTRTVLDAQAAQAAGIQMFSIGITSAVNLQELQSISSPPQQMNRNWFQSEDFNTLTAVMQQVLTPICEGGGSQTTNLGTGC